MPSRCCAPGCRSNYDISPVPPQSVFTFPLKDPVKLQKWLKEIPRDINVNKHTVICQRHFADYFLIKTKTVKDENGELKTVDREKPQLSKVAFPSIYFVDEVPCRSKPTNSNSTSVKRKISSIPDRLSNSDPLNLSNARRTTPDKRRRVLEDRFQEDVSGVVKNDLIHDFSYFTSNVNEHITNSHASSWIVQRKDTCSYFYSFDLDSPISKVVSIIKVNHDLSLKVYTLFKDSLIEQPTHIIRPYLDSAGQIKSWDYFSSLLKVFQHTETDPEFQSDDLLHQIGSVCEKLLQIPTLEEVKKEKVCFLKEQFSLLKSTINRYSTDTTLISYKLYVTNKKSYNILRSTVLTLPHPSALDKLSAKFTISSGIHQSSTHKEFLRQRALSLKPHERNVCLLLDEIHISHQISYQGGRLEGAAANVEGVVEASTAQVSIVFKLLGTVNDLSMICGYRILIQKRSLYYYL